MWLGIILLQLTTLTVLFPEWARFIVLIGMFFFFPIPKLVWKYWEGGQCHKMTLHLRPKSPSNISQISCSNCAKKMSLLLFSCFQHPMMTWRVVALQNTKQQDAQAVCSSVHSSSSAINQASSADNEWMACIGALHIWTHIYLLSSVNLGECIQNTNQCLSSIRGPRPLLLAKLAVWAHLLTAWVLFVVSAISANLEVHCSTAGHHLQMLEAYKGRHNSFLDLVETRGLWYIYDSP